MRQTVKTSFFDYNFRAMSNLSRREFLKLGGLSLGTLAFSPSLSNFDTFDDSELVRVATKSVSIYSRPTDKSSIISTWYRDELLHVYGEVKVDEPAHNPIWYRVWGGFVHRSHLQRVKVLYNETLPFLADGTRQVVEVTVPFTEPWRTSKTYGWQKLGFRLYYQSTHWVEAIEAGPTGEPWYRVVDDLAGSYHVDPLHVRPVPAEEMAPITPDVPLEKKRIEVNLTMQTLTAFEEDKQVLRRPFPRESRTVHAELMGFRQKRRRAIFVSLRRTQPNIWAMGISLRMRMIMNSRAFPGRVSSQPRDMPFMAPTGTRTLVCR